MIILGGCPIGIELAQAFTRLGTKVTVVERLSQILSADDKDLTDIVMDILKTEGVEFTWTPLLLAHVIWEMRRKLSSKRGMKPKASRQRFFL